MDVYYAQKSAKYGPEVDVRTRPNFNRTSRTRAYALITGDRVTRNSPVTTTTTNNNNGNL